MEEERKGRKKAGRKGKVLYIKGSALWKNPENLLLICRHFINTKLRLHGFLSQEASRERHKRRVWSHC